MTAAIRAYYSLTKPGIIRGNLIAATAGFLLASKAEGSVDVQLFIATLAGISLVIASACVLNNYIDRPIDAKMNRTKQRALLTGAVSPQAALVYATILGVAGFIVLAGFVSPLVALLGNIAFVFYVVLYGIAKRRSIHGTLVGTIPGALPPVAGYAAVSNNLDIGAVLLFFILVFWQMAHFYSIAIYRLKDYAAASLPVMPVKKGVPVTQVQIMAYIVAFTAVAPLLTVAGITGYSYLTVVLALGLSWLWVGALGFRSKDPTKWARTMFIYSLLVMSLLSLSMVADALFA